MTLDEASTYNWIMTMNRPVKVHDQTFVVSRSDSFLIGQPFEDVHEAFDDLGWAFVALLIILEEATIIFVFLESDVADAQLLSIDRSQVPVSP